MHGRYGRADPPAAPDARPVWPCCIRRGIRPSWVRPTTEGPMESVPLFGSAFHGTHEPRPAHRRVRGLSATEWHQPIPLTLVLRARHGWHATDRSRVRSWAHAN